ncbi:KTSC domain-containing protein [Taibaiella koreensis]|uniref:KTSC domain-containing protein n=1 Tax=Taibaiella koreensis TaxID=1268548 RepID=UPI000E59DC43|nr:KTSC domain-containing protein [Taibaiella koreensis]
MPSTVIAHIAYNEAKQVLTIKFLSGAVYAYYDVPAELYGRMTRAKSKGKFLNRHIKDHYAFEKLDED